MNFLELVQRLHSESLRSTTAPSSVTGQTDRNQRLVNWIGDAWQELQSERDWKWMRATLDATLTAAQQTYTGTALGATSFGRWRKEDDTYQVYCYIAGQPNSRWTLNQWQLDEFRDSWVYLNTGDSTPLAWASDESQQLLLGPVPKEAYKIRIEYWKEPNVLTDDDDEPDFPTRYHMLLVWRALQEVAKSDAAPEVLARADKNYMDIHQKLLRDQARLPHL